ncbi:aconitate hydratase AcnA [Sporosarcina sp. G11-34]|uniref:aconitate hydratase AcnA n=1 Tax=Sporosarcina sp. G11-34 TaxID=2849605 RepID=UPI0022A90F75|nr:aconitate hydratase AcnA [Sporosarcina sp. G11-34]MCZ2260524.1 aconitate hydratase AcnA [Sporosarcina sp. G11-34]
MDYSEIKSEVYTTLKVEDNTYHYYSLQQLEGQGMGNISRLPYSIKALLESAIRQFDGKQITDEHIALLANWQTTQRSNKEIPFKPARVILQDFTGVPAIVDLAAMRSAVVELEGNSELINPQIPVDLIVDHSVIVDSSGNEDAFNYNLELEYERNAERYRFVRWAQQAFDNFRVVPPASGIVHQVNLEHLGTSVTTTEQNGSTEVHLDTLVGTDSHTPMINGLGTIGWGVGGIEAEAAMLGQPLYFVIPEVVGVKLVGKLPEGSTATDLALTVTSLLREKGVVGKIVEFFGSSLAHITLADRATIANMAPEYGATMSFFPTDEVTMDYLDLTGRSRYVELSKAYHQAQGLFRTELTEDPVFTEVIELDLTKIVPSLAGPKRPQDKVALTAMKEEFMASLSKPVAERGYGLPPEELERKFILEKSETELTTGDIVLAAITSCTNTSNPYVMIAAGLLAKKAVEKGLVTATHVKTSLTPGSTVVTKYLQHSGLLAYLEELGFYVDGYGCGACCGNTGPLAEEIEDVIQEHDLIVSSVLSGNRNFEGRVHPLIKANYLGSPPLVVAYALAGSVQKDLINEPLGKDLDGNGVYLKDIWPSSKEIEEITASTVHATLFESQYGSIFENDRWNAIHAPTGPLYEWDENSTYIQEAPFLKSVSNKESITERFQAMNVLLMLRDSITTDHISPVGHIALTSPAGIYLTERGVSPRQFNSYGSRRGNHHVMMRGTFANIRLRNELVEGKEGGYTKFFPTGEILPVFDAAMKYQEINKSLLIIAGGEYGTGSSRDWAAKGTALLGVKAVLAESFERIHRSNLVGMGVLPIQFMKDENASYHNLDGTEQFDITGLNEVPSHGQRVTIKVTKSNGEVNTFKAIVRLDSVVEVEHYMNGGILPFVMKQFTL